MGQGGMATPGEGVQWMLGRGMKVAFKGSVTDHGMMSLGSWPQAGLTPGDTLSLSAFCCDLGCVGWSP